MQQVKDNIELAIVGSLYYCQQFTDKHCAIHEAPLRILPVEKSGFAIYCCRGLHYPMMHEITLMPGHDGED